MYYTSIDKTHPDLYAKLVNKLNISEANIQRCVQFLSSYKTQSPSVIQQKGDLNNENTQDNSNSVWAKSTSDHVEDSKLIQSPYDWSIRNLQNGFYYVKPKEPQWIDMSSPVSESGTYHPQTSSKMLFSSFKEWAKNVKENSENNWNFQKTNNRIIQNKINTNMHQNVSNSKLSESSSTVSLFSLRKFRKERRSQNLSQSFVLDANLKHSLMVDPSCK